MTKKILGILGGMGPYATLDFFKEILDNTPAKKDWEHIHIIINNNPHIPSRTRALLYNETSPCEEMLNSIKVMENAGITHLVLPCNSAHYFLYQIKDKINVEIIDLIESTVEEVIKDSSIKRVGVIGGYVTINKNLYGEAFKKYNVEVLYLEEQFQNECLNIIEETKLNKINSSLNNRCKNLIDSFENCDAVILSCTELPLALGSEKTKLPIYNPSQIVSKKIVNLFLTEKCNIGEK